MASNREERFYPVIPVLAWLLLSGYVKPYKEPDHDSESMVEDL